MAKKNGSKSARRTTKPQTDARIDEATLDAQLAEADAAGEPDPAPGELTGAFVDALAGKPESDSDPRVEVRAELSRLGVEAKDALAAYREAAERVKAARAAAQEVLIVYRAVQERRKALRERLEMLRFEALSKKYGSVR